MYSDKFTQKFAKKIEASKQKNIYLIRGEDKGLECWHYVLVENLKLPLLQARIRKLPCDFDVADYGRIIISGWGENPSVAVKNKVESGDFEFAPPSDGWEIFHVTPTTAEGKQFFAFVAVPNPLAEKFNYLMNKEGSTMDLHQWGKVLKWGWGEASDSDFEENCKIYNFRESKIPDVLSG